MNQELKRIAIVFGIAGFIGDILLMVSILMEVQEIKALVPELWTALVIFSITIIFLCIGWILLLLLESLEEAKVFIKEKLNKILRKYLY